MKKIFFSILIFGFVVSFANAQNGNETDSISNNIIIKLVTIGPGNELTSWWGHTAIIVDDLNTGKSLFYNYGLFSFEDKNFVLNFIMGRLIFWVGAWRTPNALAYYRGLDRDIRFQTLNLSIKETMEIKRFLENNVLPENSKYLYDHYYDNCSTRLRDIFNSTSNGELFKIAKEKSRMTLREHTRRHTYHSPIMDFILMFLMSDVIDKEITVWDDMFLPTEMEMVLDNLKYKSDEGELKPIIKNKYSYYKSKTVSGTPDRAPIHWPYTLVMGVVLCGLAIWFAHAKYEKTFFIYNMIISLMLGFIGTILFFLTTFTDHTVTYHNENLFFANPLTIMLFILAILVLKNKTKYFNFFYFGLMAITVFAFIGIFVKILPAFDQNNLQAITLIFPILIGSFVSTHMLKKYNNSKNKE